MRKVAELTRHIHASEYSSKDSISGDQLMYLPFFKTLAKNDLSAELVENKTEPSFAATSHVMNDGNEIETYNFEVESFHTYIAGGYRVHNESAENLVFADAEFYNKFGYEFDGSDQSTDRLIGAIADGSIKSYGSYSSTIEDDRFATTALDHLKSKIIISVGELDWTITHVRNGIRERTQTIDPITGKIIKVQSGELTARLGDGAAGVGESLVYDEENAIKEIITSVGQKLNYVAATAALGTQIGNAIAGDNFAAKIATSALLSTFLGNFAASLGAGPGGTKTIAVVGENGVINIDQIIDSTFSSLGPQLNANVRGQLVGALSAFLVAELAETLGLKDGVTKGVFTTVVSGVTTTVGQQLVENIVAMMDPKTAATATLLHGFDTAKISGNIQNALGAYFGSELGKLIVTPKTPEAALFASAAASVMSTLLSGFPVIGPFIGSAIGQTFGAIIGRIVFDNDMSVKIHMVLDRSTGAIIISKGEAHDSTRNEWNFSAEMATKVVDNINNFVVNNKFSIDVGAAFHDTHIGLWANPHNTRMISVNGVDIASIDNIDAATRAARSVMAINYAESDIIKRLDLIIPDPLVRRSYYASRDDGLTQLSMDLKIAADYRMYLENPLAINAMIAQDPNSKFSAGWAITLLRAKELGLDRVSAMDFRGGFYVNLKDHETVHGPRGTANGFAPERLAWIPDFEASDLSAGHTNSGSLLLRSADGLSTVTAEDVFAPGKLTSIVGANNTTAVDARGVSPTERSLVFVKAGNGDKYVYGSEKWGSIIVGGNGKQTLVGGSGNDWLRAGDNNIALLGGEGDDLLVAGTGTPLLDGGKGRNTYLLGPDGADVRISAVDPNGSDTIIAVTSGARLDNNIIDISARPDGHAVHSSKTISPDLGSVSGFARSGADLVITTVSGYVQPQSYTDEYGTVISMGDSFYADTATGKVIVKNFFLTDSGIDLIKFSDGSSFTNAEIWREAKVNIRVDDKLWNSNQNTSTNTVVDTRNEQAGFFAQQTTTFAGNNLFVAMFSDDGTLWTSSSDQLEKHDWRTWETAYKTDGTINADAVTLDVTDESGNFVKVFHGAGGVVAGDTGDDVLKAATAGSTLIGDRGNDDLVGSGGVDALYGGSGDDHYTVGAGDKVFEFAGQGTDIVEATASYTLAAGQEIEELRLANPAGTTALNLTGNERNDTLVGNAGANVLNGAGGSDVMRGGGGNDTYIVDIAGDKVEEGAGEGTDEVRTVLSSYTLGAEIETLRYTGGSAFSGTGNALDNTLWGGAGNDTLNGGSGDDGLHGQGGNDTYRVDNINDRVFEAVGGGRDTVITVNSFTLQVGQEIEVVQMADTAATTTRNLTGNEFANTLIGNAGTNTLWGRAGNDVLDGGDGNDVMYGQEGDDTYRVDNASDQVFEAAGEGRDTIITENSFTLQAGQEIEVVQMADPTGTTTRNLLGNEFDNTLIGNAGVNTLWGRAGNDVLDGGDGNDVLRGQEGNDTYRVDNINDEVFEAAGEGRDTIITENSFTLATGQEIEIVKMADLDGTTTRNLAGNEFANTLIGNAGENNLYGRDGNDILDGGAGADRIDGGGGIDAVSFGTASRGVSVNLESGGTWEGGAGDVLVSIENAVGSRFDDTLKGSAGSNTLYGDGGNDTLIGNGGSDTFVFRSALGTTNVDSITDFASGDDRIMLDAGFMPGLAKGTLAASAFKNISQASADADDRILYKQATGELFFDADGSGSGAAVRFAILENKASLVYQDLLVA